MFDRTGAFATFVRIVEAGSISAAARALGLSQSAVSQSLKALEGRLAVRLIDRDTQGMTLTEAGRAFYKKAKVALEAMADAEAVAQEASRALSGRLKVQAPVAFGERYLGKMLIAFQALHPGIIVELVLEDRFIDVVTEGIDLAIRFGGLTSDTLIVRKLGMVERLLVAAPGYLAAAPPLRTPDDLGRHRYVKFSLIATGDSVPLIRKDERVEARVNPTFIANNGAVLMEALVAGRGVGAAQLMHVTEHLASGALKKVLPSWRYEPLPIHAVYPSARFIPARARALVAHIQEGLNTVPGIA